MLPYLRARPHFIGLGAALLLAAAIGLASYIDWQRYSELLSRADQSRVTVEHAHALLSALKDAEIGQRGFLLTGNRSYLEPWESARPVIQRELRDLKNTARPEAASRISHLARIITDKVEELNKTIGVRRSGDTERALAMLRTDRGKQIMDDIRITLTGIIAREEQELEVVRRGARRSSLRARQLVLLGTGFLVVLVLGAAVHVNGLLHSKELLIRRLEGAHSRGLDQRALLETTLGGIGDAVITADTSSNVRFMNAVAEKLTGWSREEAVGQPVQTVLPLLDEARREPLEDVVALAIRTGAIVDLPGPALLVNRAGQEIPVEESASPIRDPLGATTGVVLALRDVSVRRKAQQALEASEQRYRLLFDRNPQPMWVYEIESLAFTAVNEAAIALYGYSRQEFLAMKATDILPEEEKPRLLEEPLPSDGIHARGSWRHRTRDGRLLSVEVTVAPLIFQDRRACLVMPSNITDRVRLEEQLRQAQKLEAVGQLAGGVAHDFNNLLTLIVGHGRMLEEERQGDETTLYRIEKILYAADRAAALTSQLLAFSRQSITHPRVLNINKLVSVTEHMLRRVIGENIRLDVALSTDLGNTRIDPGHFEQILINLVLNARDATPGNGRIMVETMNVRIGPEYARTHTGVDTGGHYVMLAVTDTGTGMDEATKARIFEPFFTTKEPGRGTGLGLSTVYGIVKQNGGHIWVYSEPGRGTTFKIYLPRVFDTAQEQEAPPLTTLPAKGTETILLIEDDNALRELARQILVSRGYTVLEAASGSEALHLCTLFHGKLHLLLTDVVMPGMSGKEVADQIVKLHPRIAVVYMTGYTENSIIRQGVVEDDVNLIEKPFTPESLAAILRAVLDRRENGRPNRIS